MANRLLVEIEKDILDLIKRTSPAWAGKNVWVVKYFAPKLITNYFQSGPTGFLVNGLWISRAREYTWGTGCYVADLDSTLSSMMFGRCGFVGVVGEFKQVYDVRDRYAQELYQEWITHYDSLFYDLTLTMHSQLANSELRDKFKETFQVDTIVFPPDQLGPPYTSQLNDIWYLLVDWDTDGMGKSVIRRIGYSDRFTKLAWVILGTEEFGDLGEKEVKHMLGKHLLPSQNFELLKTSDLKNYLENIKRNEPDAIWWNNRIRDRLLVIQPEQ